MNGLITCKVPTNGTGSRLIFTLGGLWDYIRSVRQVEHHIWGREYSRPTRLVKLVNRIGYPDCGCRACHNVLEPLTRAAFSAWKKGLNTTHVLRGKTKCEQSFSILTSRFNTMYPHSLNAYGYQAKSRPYNSTTSSHCTRKLAWNPWLVTPKTSRRYSITLNSNSFESFISSEKMPQHSSAIAAPIFVDLQCSPSFLRDIKHI